jgi:hypothetical protein
MSDASASKELAAGERLSRLLVASPTWVNRRVDSLRLDADGSTRRFVSVDMTLPEEWAIDGGEETVLVPLGILEKGTKQRLDASHEGKAISVLNTFANAEQVAMMLVSSLPRTFDLTRSELTSAQKLFSKIAGSSTADKAAAEKMYTTWRDEQLLRFPVGEDDQRDLDYLNGVVKQMLSAFILFVELDRKVVGRRTVVKYAFDQNEPSPKGSGTKRLVIEHPVPDLGFAASFHFEVEVPVGIMVESLTIMEDDDPKQVTEGLSAGRIAHVNVSPGDVQSSGKVFVELLVPGQGIFSFTGVALLLLALLVVLADVVRGYEDVFLRSEPEIPSPAASILLIGPALLISWVSRLPEHPLVARMVQPLRHMLLVLSLCLVLIAGLAAVKVQPAVWSVTWFAVNGLTVLLVARFIAFWTDRWFRRS